MTYIAGSSAGNSLSLVSSIRRAIFSHTHSYHAGPSSATPTVTVQGHLQPHLQLPCRAIFSHTHSYRAGPSSATPTVTVQGHLQPHPQLPCRAIFSHTHSYQGHLQPHPQPHVPAIQSYMSYDQRYHWCNHLGWHLY